MPKFIFKIHYETDPIENDDTNSAYQNFWDNIFPKEKLLYDFIDEHTKVIPIPKELDLQKLAQELAGLVLQKQTEIYGKDIETAMDGDWTEKLASLFLLKLNIINGNISQRKYETKIKKENKKPAKFNNKRKLKRDCVVSVVNGEDLVGIYVKDDPQNLLLECSPKKADKLIKLFNNK